MKKKKRLKPLPAGVRYIVTAVNTLSGERERISNPTTKEAANKMCDRLKKKASSQRSYLRPRIEIYTGLYQPDIFGGGREILGATI